MDVRRLTLPLLLFVWHTVISFTFCYAQHADFGVSKIKKSPDGVAAQQAINNIKSIPNAAFEAGSFKGKDSVGIKYRLLKPVTVSGKNQKLPLVIVFHGSNAVGLDNVSQLGVLAKLWASPDIQARYPAYVVVPQFPTRSSNYVMDNERGVLTSVPQPCLQVSLQLIDSLTKHIPAIDKRRIYCIGFSMGGSSVINVLSMRPDLFAAAVSLSGIPQFEHVAALTTIPIWLLHGDVDTENPFNSDAQFYKEVGMKNKTRLWIMEDTAHNDIFAGPILGDAIPEWLFSKKKK